MLIGFLLNIFHVANDFIFVKVNVLSCVFHQLVITETFDPMLCFCFPKLKKKKILVITLIFYILSHVHWRKYNTQFIIMKKISNVPSRQNNS